MEIVLQILNDIPYQMRIRLIPKQKGQECIRNISWKTERVTRKNVPFKFYSNVSNQPWMIVFGEEERPRERERDQERERENQKERRLRHDS